MNTAAISLVANAAVCYIQHQPVSQKIRRNFPQTFCYLVPLLHCMVQLTSSRCTTKAGNTKHANTIQNKRVEKIGFGAIHNSRGHMPCLATWAHCFFAIVLPMWTMSSPKRSQNNHMPAPVKVARQQTTPELS